MLLLLEKSLIFKDLETERGCLEGAELFVGGGEEQRSGHRKRKAALICGVIINKSNTPQPQKKVLSN